MTKRWRACRKPGRSADPLAAPRIVSGTGTEIGFNLLGSPGVVILPANVAQFTQDLDASDRDVTLFLLLREAARQRLFHHVAWLSPQLSALLGHFAREITIDFDAIASQFQPENLQNLSIEDVVAVGESVRGSFFQPASTPTQIEILQRLEVLLALVRAGLTMSSAAQPRRGCRTRRSWRRSCTGAAPPRRR